MYSCSYKLQFSYGAVTLTQMAFLLARAAQVYLVFGARLIQTLLRTALGPLIIFVCADTECDDSGSKGSILAAFSLGYLSTQIVGGMLGDRFGTKPVTCCGSTIAVQHTGSQVITAGAVLAGLATAGTALAQNTSTIWAAQVAMGMAQGPLFPSSVAHLSRWLVRG